MIGFNYGTDIFGINDGWDPGKFVPLEKIFRCRFRHLRSIVNWSSVSISISVLPVSPNLSVVSIPQELQRLDERVSTVRKANLSNCTEQ